MIKLSGTELSKLGARTLHIIGQMERGTYKSKDSQSKAIISVLAWEVQYCMYSLQYTGSE